MAKKKVVQSFGLWNWFGEARRQTSNKLFYLVTCSCEKQISKWIRKSSLEAGDSQSCGCLQKISASKRAIERAEKKGPGKKDHPYYEIWNGMHQRCYNEKAAGYNRYGGRGISICDEWRRPNPDGLKNFATYMGERPEYTTVDRIDNDGNYEPGNVRWATMLLQSENRIIYPHCRLTDMTNTIQDFGHWKFLGQIERRYIEDQPSTRFYHVSCGFCGSEHWVRKQDLKNKRSTKCVACARKNTKA